MARQRDYAREYAVRIRNGLSKGRSRSVARGHARAGESPASAKHRAVDERVQQALSHVYGGLPTSEAARRAHVAPERLRRELPAVGGEKHSGRWVIAHKHAISVPLYSEGKRIVIVVGGESQAARVGSFMGTVGVALTRNDPSPLRRYVGGGVVDIEGTLHLFETDLATLYALDAQGPNPWETAYNRIG